MAATSTEKRRPDSSTFGSSSAIVVDPSTKCESSSEISRTNGCLSVKVDGCWAWVVSLAAFLIMMFVDGISFTYGIVSKEFSRYFHLEDNVAKGTLPGAVLLGFYMMAGKLYSICLFRLIISIVWVNSLFNIGTGHTHERTHDGIGHNSCGWFVLHNNLLSIYNSP